jgi:ATP-dependent DNA helicase RecG
MNDLQSDIQFLKGVGERRAILLRRLGIRTIGDLVEYFPRMYINRQVDTTIYELMPGVQAAVVGSIIDFQVKRLSGGKTQLNVVISDGKSSLLCTWFRYGEWLTKAIKPGARMWVSGMVSEFSGRMQIIHPDYEILEDETEETGFWKNRSTLPVYSLTENLSMKLMRNIVVQAFSQYAEQIEETLPEQLMKQFEFTPRKIALQKMHFTQHPDEIDEIKRRFVFEEFLFSQLLWARSRYHVQKEVPGFAFIPQKTFTTKLKNKLPFELTGAQKRVVKEIFSDMAQPKPMQRLLQGDVGSGKTVVTLFAMLLAVENGFQAVIMAPTEILAEQHYRNVTKLLQDQPELNVALLKGGVYKGKNQVKEDIANGKIQIIIGTHALIQKDVEYKKIGFVAIDEQHRFGVEQRAELYRKAGTHPDLLYLSATPIPRSLAMTVFGDLEVSKLDEMPPGRKPVHTIWHNERQKPVIYKAIMEELGKGRQIYIVCPLVEESEKSDLLDAETLYGQISQHVFPNYKSAILHGRMTNEMKNSIMHSYQSGETQILVSTTVIEVGVDVANATVMMIEHAERFGLAQLHQLRGRVGRGAEKSYCYLIAYPPISNIGRERLQTMVETQDGFLIAEKDLELRGPGEFFGKEQSGRPVFKHANLVKDQEMLRLARIEAFQIIEADYSLQKPANRLLHQKYMTEYLAREKLIEY